MPSPHSRPQRAMPPPPRSSWRSVAPIPCTTARAFLEFKGSPSPRIYWQGCQLRSLNRKQPSSNCCCSLPQNCPKARLFEIESNPSSIATSKIFLAEMRSQTLRFLQKPAISFPLSNHEFHSFESQLFCFGQTELKGPEDVSVFEANLKIKCTHICICQAKNTPAGCRDGLTFSQARCGEVRFFSDLFCPSVASAKMSGNVANSAQNTRVKRDKIVGFF